MRLFLKRDAILNIKLTAGDYLTWRNLHLGYSLGR